MVNFKRIKYFDGLKGIGCLMIMICHYLGLIKYAQSINNSYLTHTILSINNSIFSSLINETIWLQLFFIISGYLISFTKINNLKELIKKILHRFMRFFIPILAACFIIFILQISIGFHNSDTKILFLNDWFQSSYNQSVSIIDVIFAPFKIILLGKVSEFNTPYWVINEMFIASIIIYCYKLYNSNHQKNSGGGHNIL